MRIRLVVIAIFVSATAVPGVLACTVGVLPSGSETAAAAKVVSPEFRVTALGWPDRAAGLATNGTLIVWQQPGDGLRAYDVRSQQPVRLLERRTVGRRAGRPSMWGNTVVWTATIHGQRHRSTEVRAYDRMTARCWRVAARALEPAVCGRTIVWVERHGSRSSPRDGIAGLNTVTDESFALQADGRIRQATVWGPWLAWVSRDRGRDSVWSSTRHGSERYLLAVAGGSVAIDRHRVVWSARVERGGDAIVSWNRHSRHSKVLCRTATPATGLSLSGELVAWTQKTGNGDIWVYDFTRCRSFPVCADPGPQSSPVVVGRSVFWADRRSGSWELYGRSPWP